MGAKSGYRTPCASTKEWYSTYFMYHSNSSNSGMRSCWSFITIVFIAAGSYTHNIGCCMNAVSHDGIRLHQDDYSRQTKCEAWTRSRTSSGARVETSIPVCCRAAAYDLGEASSKTSGKMSIYVYTVP